MNRRILGVDPGLRTTGYGVIEVTARRARLIEAGVIQPNPRAPIERRLSELHGAMDEIVRTLRPDCMVVEELWTAYRNPTTAVLMGHARGVLCLVAGVHGVTLEALAHSLVKRALVGNGAARKEQVQNMVASLLGLRAKPEPDDVADALALAIAYAYRSGGVQPGPAPAVKAR